MREGRQAGKFPQKRFFLGGLCCCCCCSFANITDSNSTFSLLASVVTSSLLRIVTYTEITITGWHAYLDRWLSRSFRWRGCRGKSPHSSGEVPSSIRASGKFPLHRTARHGNCLYIHTDSLPAECQAQYLAPASAWKVTVFPTEAAVKKDLSCLLQIPPDNRSVKPNGQ